jgi:hypothetical protein
MDSSDILNIDNIIARLLEGKYRLNTASALCKKRRKSRWATTPAGIASLFRGIFFPLSHLFPPLKSSPFFFFRSVRGSRPGKNVQLTESEIRGLCLKSREIFLSQPILLELEAPLKICGE